MIRGLYAIRDNVATSIVGGVHVHAHDAPAIRMFSDIAASKGTQVEQHLDDFDLIRVAMIDDETGEVDSSGEVEIVIKGVTLRSTWEAQAAAKQQNPEG